MRIFISSLIRGFEEFRQAAVAAVRSLGHEPIIAEDFSAGVSSPRIACLEGVRNADMVILILGRQYGAVQSVSGTSATHEEYREAKDRRPVISFFQDGVVQEPAQQEFVREVQDWSNGLFGGKFRTPEELRDAVTRAIHQHAIAAATTPVHPGEMLARALELIPREDRTYMRRGGALLHLAVVGGPAQTILRPAQIEAPDLSRDLMREATYGPSPIFDSAHGSEPSVREGSLVLRQETGATILIDERGSVRLAVPIARGTGMLGALIEENVAEAIRRALAHAAEILARIDETQRLARVVIAAGIDSNGALGWRTQQEDADNPNSMTMASMYNHEGRQAVHFQPPDRPRAALAFDRQTVTEDLVALLRRQWQ